MTEMANEELQARFDAMAARHEGMRDVEALKATQTTALEVSDDPTVLRTILHEMVVALRGESGRPASRERSLAVTKLQEAMFWLMQDMAQS
jgi:hypothetical protein